MPKVNPQFMLTEEGYYMPFNQEAIDFVNRRKAGDVADFELYIVRSPELNARFHVMISNLYQQLPEKYALHFPNVDDLRYFLTKQAGYTIQYINPITGEYDIRAQSINFRAMGEDKFKQVFADVVEVLKDLIPVLWGDLPEEQFQVLLETITGMNKEYSQA